MTLAYMKTSKEKKGRTSEEDEARSDQNKWVMSSGNFSEGEEEEMSGAHLHSAGSVYLNKAENVLRQRVYRTMGAGTTGTDRR